ESKLWMLCAPERSTLQSDSFPRKMTYFNDPDDDVLETASLRVVVQYEGAVQAFGAAERWRLHSRVDGRQVVVQCVQVLQKVLRGGAQHLQDRVVAGVLAKIKKRSAEHFENLISGNFYH